eukprot:PhF_6_TR2312/c0_g1_i1/m.4082
MNVNLGREKVVSVLDESTLEKAMLVPESSILGHHLKIANQGDKSSRGGSASSTHAGHTISIEESLTFEDLALLKTRMDAAGTKTFEIDEDDFVDMIQTHLPTLGRSTEEYKKWFRRIDANANGCVNWDEVGTYLLSEGQQRTLTDNRNFEYITTAQPRHTKSRGAHCEEVSQIVVNNRFNKVLTCGKDGKIKQWYGDSLGFEKVIYNGSRYIVDAKLMSMGQRLLTCQVDRKLCLFDCKQGEMIRCYAGKKSITIRKKGEEPFLVPVGQEAIGTRGNRSDQKYGVSVDLGVSSFNVRQVLGQELSLEDFQKKIDEHREFRTHRTIETVTLNDFIEPPQCLEVFERGSDDLVFMGLRDGKLLGYKMLGQSFNLDKIYSGQIHTEAIAQCRYSKTQQGVFTCSWDRGIKLINIESNVHKEFGTEVRHEKSIFTMDWNDNLKMLVTGGTERDLFVWHPVMEKKPLFKMTGHQASLLKVLIVEAQNQIISLSADRCMKIWDTRIFKCMQTIHDMSAQSEHVFPLVAYDPQRQRIVSGGSMPVYYSLKQAHSTFPMHYNGHTNPLVQVLFTNDFQQVITVDHETVNVWNINTGERVFNFMIPMEHETRINSAMLDSNGRRLITSTNSGDIRMWNSFNGQCLNAYESKTIEVHGMAHIQRTGPSLVNAIPGLSHDKHGTRKCLVTSTLGQLHIYQDSEQFEVYVHQSLSMPRTSQLTGVGDVSSMAPITDILVAVGTERGIVFFVNVLTASVESGFIPPSIMDEISMGSRVQGIAPLKSKGDVMLVAKNDGSIEFWNTKLKEAIGSTSITSETLLENPCVFPNDECFCYTDGVGNVHVHSLLECPHSLTHVDSEIIPHAYSFKAHSDAITSIMACCPSVTENQVFIITGAVDCYVKIFTANGICVGVFGDRKWSIMSPESWVSTERTPPASNYFGKRSEALAVKSVCSTEMSPSEYFDMQFESTDPMRVEAQRSCQEEKMPLLAIAGPPHTAPVGATRKRASPKKKSKSPLRSLGLQLDIPPPTWSNEFVPKAPSYDDDRPNTTRETTRSHHLSHHADHNTTAASPHRSPQREKESSPRCLTARRPSPPPRPPGERKTNVHNRRLGILRPEFATLVQQQGMIMDSSVYSPKLVSTENIFQPYESLTIPQGHQSQLDSRGGHSVKFGAMVVFPPQPTDQSVGHIVSPMSPTTNRERDTLKKCYEYMKDQVRGLSFFDNYQSQSDTAQFTKRSLLMVQQRRKDREITSSGLPHWTEQVSSKINLDLAKPSEVTFKKFETNPRSTRGHQGLARKRSVLGTK